MVVELWLSVAHACDAPLAPSELDARLAEAEAAFAGLDIPGFLALSDAIRADVPCLSAVPTPTEAARLHRVEAFRRFGDRDVSAARWFAAARASDPAFVLDPEVAPPGSPLAADWAAIDLSAGRTAPVPEPTEGTLWIDGAQTRERPQVWPSLVQWVGPDDAVRFTHWAPPDEALPEYPAVPPPPEPIGPDPGLEGPRALPLPPRSPRVALAVATSAAAVTTGVVYGVGAVSRSRWADPETPDDELPGLVARTNALAVGSVLGALTTAGLGTALVVTW